MIFNRYSCIVLLDIPSVTSIEPCQEGYRPSVSIKILIGSSLCLSTGILNLAYPMLSIIVDEIMAPDCKILTNACGTGEKSMPSIIFNLIISVFGKILKLPKSIVPDDLLNKRYIVSYAPPIG